MVALLIRCSIFLLEKGRYNIWEKVSIIGLVVNILLSIIKIFVGIVSASMALIADGLHSVSDIASTIEAQREHIINVSHLFSHIVRLV